ncbi:unnamed protein product [Effrenium voratum]|nr:unnamed protein product [Effrenium voratum]
MLLTTGLACLCALLTLVRALEFLKASLHCGSLAELRSCAWDSSCEALGALWELLALLFFWDSYKTLVRSAVCALLLPAWGLLLLPHGLRILLWLGLCALPWTLPLHWVLRSLAAVEAVFFLVALLRRRAAAAQETRRRVSWGRELLKVPLGPLMGNQFLVNATLGQLFWPFPGVFGGSVAVAEGFRELRKGEEAVPAHMKTLRISGMNALALISLVVDAVLLSSLDVLAPTLRQEGWLYGAVAVTALWLLVISLPHAMSKDESSEKDDCLSSGKFHVGMQLLRRLLLPAAIVFSVQVLAGEMALDGAYGASARGACLGLAFLTFTTVLGLDLHTHAQDHLPDSVGLDIVQPSAFLGGLLFAQLLFLNRALEQNMEGGSGLYPAVTSLLMPAWVLGYAALGGSLGGPLWLWPLQLGAALAPAWGAWTAALKLNENVTWAGFAGLCFLSLCGASLVELLASRWRRAALEKEVGLMEMDEPAGMAFRGIYHCLHRALPVEELQKMFRASVRTDLDSVYDVTGLHLGCAGLRKERCILAAGVPCRRYNVPVRQSLLRLFESYHAALDQSVSDPLALLSSLLKGLALLHPLPERDRNGRSRLLLLQRELRRLNLACGTMNYNNNNNDSVETYTLKLREGIAMYEEAAASQRNPWLDPTKAAKHLTTFPVKFEKEMRECYQTYGPNIGYAAACVSPAMRAVALLLLLQAKAVAGKTFPKIPQHLCCATVGPNPEDVRAMLPEAFNHSAVRTVECTKLSGTDFIHRVGTACSYCMCLWEDGGDLSTPQCCSLTNFGTPGYNTATGYTTCQKYKQTYNLKTGVVRSCELRYDMYSFKSAARRWSLLAPLAVLTGALA